MESRPSKSVATRTPSALAHLRIVQFEAAASAIGSYVCGSGVLHFGLLRLAACTTVDLVNVVVCSFPTQHHWPNSHRSPRSAHALFIKCNVGPLAQDGISAVKKCGHPNSQRSSTPKEWFNLKLPLLRSVRMCVVLVSFILGFCDWLHAQIHWYDQNRSSVNPLGILNRPPPSSTPHPLLPPPPPTEASRRHHPTLDRHHQCSSRT